MSRDEIFYFSFIIKWWNGSGYHYLLVLVVFILVALHKIEIFQIHLFLCNITPWGLLGPKKKNNNNNQQQQQKCQKAPFYCCETEGEKRKGKISDQLTHTLTLKGCQTMFLDTYQCCSQGHGYRGQGHSVQGQGHSLQGRGQGRGLAYEAKAKASTEFYNMTLCTFKTWHKKSYAKLHIHNLFLRLNSRHNCVRTCFGRTRDIVWIRN